MKDQYAEAKRRFLSFNLKEERVKTNAWPQRQEENSKSHARCY